MEPDLVAAYPYPPIHLPTASSAIFANSLQYGANYYTFIAEQDQDALEALDCRQQFIESLRLRCQSDEQLVRNKFILPTQTSMERAQTKLPLGVFFYDYVASPSPDPSRRNKRAAIVIDCEMVGVRPEKNLGGSNQLPSQQTTATNANPRPKPSKLPWERSELAQLCAVDAITGETLINELVIPAGVVVNWRARYSGVNAAKIREAKAKGTILPHWRDARALLLEYMDSETVLVGHSVENDLQMLRLAHGRVVDTSMQTAAGFFGVGRVPYPRIWGLKYLTQRLTGKSIQTGGGRMMRPGRAAVVGHDCLEDTLATRELALWCILHPDGLEVWGGEMRKEIAEKEVAARKKREQEEEKKKREQEEAEAEAAAARKKERRERAVGVAVAVKARQGKAARAEEEVMEVTEAFNKLWPPMQPRSAN
ncbi:hypothetical protein PG985_007697 [Apiospora marii]|uniref:uncharacterized protein n=1 Tax=Apiospora marii TaxID=335849 RepID=UPI00312CFFA2